MSPDGHACHPPSRPRNQSSGLSTKGFGQAFCNRAGQIIHRLSAARCDIAFNRHSGHQIQITKFGQFWRRHSHKNPKKRHPGGLVDPGCCRDGRNGPKNFWRCSGVKGGKGQTTVEAFDQPILLRMRRIRKPIFARWQGSCWMAGPGHTRRHAAHWLFRRGHRPPPSGSERGHRPAAARRPVRFRHQ